MEPAPDPIRGGSQGKAMPLSVNLCVLCGKKISVNPRFLSFFSRLSFGSPAQAPMGVLGLEKL
ncbi:MAG: hypothetical protein DRP56_10265 [Planctomycetota bacterium]|nr:MAG: hypothetical protein DRP56_10265 [Planctomycetota bacterium]